MTGTLVSCSCYRGRVYLDGIMPAPCPRCSGTGSRPATPEELEELNAPHRHPYVGDGADGARRSAQIDREEAATLEVLNPRYGELMRSARRWDRQAADLEASA